MTAVKRAEARDELVVCVLNASGQSVSARVRPHRTPTAARRLDLAEEPVDDGALAVSDGWVEVGAKPWEMVTIGIGFDA